VRFKPPIVSASERSDIGATRHDTGPSALKAASAPDVTGVGVAEPLGSIQVVARNLLDKRDDASPDPWLLYAQECPRERESFGGGEEVKNVGGR
jgi:hypothetical protein